ncbi:expansin-like B1 [Andrographis paniculata]|uniref:expansin-like B1 n=1 Tax=Andrographis paniculata TaxID=175694 RepID=UPI0021E95262|nr:expansin-like B1 [Andrographis paniculata]
MYMNMNFPIFSILVLVLLVVASPCHCQDGYVCTRATYYGSPECPGNPHGACGYGEYATIVNDGLTAGVSRLYKNGSGCGACYQVRCTIPTHCSKEGTNIVVTDFAIGHYTDFVLNARAYASLALPNMASELIAYGVIDVEYRRIPCKYSYNLKLKVHERSSFPSYIAIFPIYQAGFYDIVAAQVWLEDCKEWRDMRRVFGTVWDMENPPRGALTIRIQVVSAINGEVKWVQLVGVIPTEWKAGLAYDTAIQFD